MKTLEVINQIKQIAKNNQERESSQKTRFITKDNLPIGKCIRQGDIYVFRMDNDWGVGEEVKRNQIADGVSLGARHILNGDFKVYQGVSVPKFLNKVHARVCIGYAFDVKDGCVLGHPEHDNYVFKLNGRFQVLHQLDLQTLKRAAD